MTTIIPSVFATNKEDFRKRFDKAKRLGNILQVDLMDGKFVRTRSVQLQDIPNLRGFPQAFEAHLMVRHPEKYLTMLHKKGFTKVIFHRETVPLQHAKHLIQRIRALQMVPSVSINAETPLEDIELLLPDLEHVQLMGIHPGKEGQPLQESTFDKISRLQQHYPQITIEIDGGVNLKTAPKLVKKGATLLVIGSYLGKSHEPQNALKKLKEAVKKP